MVEFDINNFPFPVLKLFCTILTKQLIRLEKLTYNTLEQIISKLQEDIWIISKIDIINNYAFEKFNLFESVASLLKVRSGSSKQGYYNNIHWQQLTNINKTHTHIITHMYGAIHWGTYSKCAVVYVGPAIAKL